MATMFAADVGVRLYKEQDGRYRIVWTGPDRRRRSLRRRDKAEAEQVAAAVAAELRRARPSADNRSRKVAELVDWYLYRQPEAAAWSPAYLARQESLCRNWIAPRMAELRCHELDRHVLAAMLADARAAGLATSTLKNLAALCTGLVAAGQEAGFIEPDRNPAERLQKLVRGTQRAGESSRYVDPSRIPPFDKVEEAACYMEQRWEWWRGLQVRAARHTGLRLGELLALRGRDVDLEHGQIDVTRAWSRKGNAFLPPKWGRTRTTFVVGTLEEALARRIAEVGVDGLLFPGADGQVDANAAYLRTRWTPARVALGWPRDPQSSQQRFLWSWHSLRHVFCTWCLASPPDGLGLEVADVAYFAGHHSPAFTLEAYLSRREGAVDRARAAARGKVEA